MDGYTLSENLIFLLGFSAAFFGLLAIVAFIVEEVMARHRRKIERFLNGHARWFK